MKKNRKIRRKENVDNAMLSGSKKEIWMEMMKRILITGKNRERREGDKDEERT